MEIAHEIIYTISFFSKKENNQMYTQFKRQYDDLYNLSKKHFLHIKHLELLERYT
jgi:hypothetical protein